MRPKVGRVSIFIRFSGYWYYLLADKYELSARPLKINVCCAESFEKKIQLKNANDNIPATVFFMLSMLHYFFLSTNPYLLEYALTLNIPQTSPLILLFTLVGVGE